MAAGALSIAGFERGLARNPPRIVQPFPGQGEPRFSLRSGSAGCYVISENSQKFFAVL